MAGTTACRTLHGCHTHPNDRLLQLSMRTLKTEVFLLSYPSKRQASTTSPETKHFLTVKVVIPIQTTGFYNVNCGMFELVFVGCHTHPNDRLLQRENTHVATASEKLSYPSKRQASTTGDIFTKDINCTVVIPIQTTGFYNKQEPIRVWKNVLSYPSKRQASTTGMQCPADGPEIKLSYPSKRQASTTLGLHFSHQHLKVVIPIQTTGFYNSQGNGSLRLLQVVIPIQTTGFYNTLRRILLVLISKLSYPSKRQASTTIIAMVKEHDMKVVIPIQTTGFYN